MLPKQYRLSSHLISDVLRHGKRVRSQAFQLMWKSGSSKVSQFAIIVSGKVDKRAVVRNRIKRLTREAIRREMIALPFSVDGVILVRSFLNPKEAKLESISVLINDLFDKVVKP